MTDYLLLYSGGSMPESEAEQAAVMKAWDEWMHALGDGLKETFARHAAASRALSAGLEAMGLELFGDQRHKMANITGVHIPEGIDGEKVRGAMLEDFGIEIGTSFGPLRGRIWRIGTMGYNCRKQNVLICLGALEAVLRRAGLSFAAGAGVEAAYAAYAAQA